MESLSELEFAKDQSNTLLRLVADTMNNQYLNGHWTED